jgi:hypothetical protein
MTENQGQKPEEERGRINGEDIVKFDTETITVSIPKEMYKVLLEIGGALGLSKRDIFFMALYEFASDPKNTALIERSQSIKAEKHGTSIHFIQSKVLGSYKRIAKERLDRLKYQPGEE